MLTPVCRACRARSGELVLDLGQQPVTDDFPELTDGGPDPRYPLRMWLCAECGLAQLADDPAVPAGPGTDERSLLVAQAADAVDRVARSGLLSRGHRVVEYGGAHGVSWLPMLIERGLRPVDGNGGEHADVVLDCFDLTRSADQTEALATRVDRLAEGATILLQYHSLTAMVHKRQWSALRFGHFAYYSTTALVGMLATAGLTPRTAWRFPLFGGTVLLAATHGGSPDQEIRALLAEDHREGVADPRTIADLQSAADESARALRGWLQRERDAGRRVFGYGVAAGSVPLLARAAVDVDLLAGIADPSRHAAGRRIPGTRIPLISEEELLRAGPDVVLLFAADLLERARAAMPALAGRWMVAEHVSTETSSAT